MKTSIKDKDTKRGREKEPSWGDGHKRMDSELENILIHVVLSYLFWFSFVSFKAQFKRVIMRYAKLSRPPHGLAFEIGGCTFWFSTYSDIGIVQSPKAKLNLQRDKTNISAGPWCDNNWLRRAGRSSAHWTVTVFQFHTRETSFVNASNQLLVFPNLRWPVMFFYFSGNYEKGAMLASFQVPCWHIFITCRVHGLQFHVISV